MRYVLNFNAEGTSVVAGSEARDTNFLQLKKLPKRLKSGATTKVRVTADDAVPGTVPFTARDTHNYRWGGTVNKELALSSGLRGRKRYTLEQAGSSEWYNLVPHSNIGKVSKKVEGPAVSVSIIENR